MSLCCCSDAETNTLISPVLERQRRAAQWIKLITAPTLLVGSALSKSLMHIMWMNQHVLVQIYDIIYARKKKGDLSWGFVSGPSLCHKCGKVIMILFKLAWRCFKGGLGITLPPIKQRLQAREWPHMTSQAPTKARQAEPPLKWDPCAAFGHFHSALWSQRLWQRSVRTRKTRGERSQRFLLLLSWLILNTPVCLCLPSRKGKGQAHGG